MGNLFQLLGLCFWFCFFGYNSIYVVSQKEGTVFISGESSIGTIDDDFICATLDWWPPEKCDYGTCSWHHASLLNLDLNNNILLNAVKAFSPLKFRLGGSLEDKVIYQESGSTEPCPQFALNQSEMFRFTEGCLPMSRWDELNNFFRKTGVVVVFGLNELYGKVVASKSSIVGPWDPSNAASLIRYTVSKNYTIHGWELGNELTKKITANQYASDVITLKNMVEDIYKSHEVKPIILAPGGYVDEEWYRELILKTPKSLDVVTHHIYNLGPAVQSQTNLTEKILDPSYLDGEAEIFSTLQSIVKSSSGSVVAWVGEAGGAYNSGRHLVSNTFVNSFWYLDQLGMAASYDTKTYCRQTLIGGNYGLLDTTTFIPNPDYYSALLWHRLMGRKVLSTNFDGTKKIRAYAHCAKQSQGITLLLINLDNSTTVHVHVTTRTAAFNQTWTMHHNRRLLQIPQNSESNGDTREEYHLTATNGSLQSRTMQLNGNSLTLPSSGNIAALEPVHVNPLEPINVAPYSIVFAHIPSIGVPACK